MPRVLPHELLEVEDGLPQFAVSKALHRPVEHLFRAGHGRGRPGCFPSGGRPAPGHRGRDRLQARHLIGQAVDGRLDTPDSAGELAEP